MLIKNKKLPKSIRKYIRRKKSEIRRSLLSREAQEEKVKETINKFLKKDSKR